MASLLSMPRTALPHECMPPAPCPFRQGYAIGPEASGVFATERLILGTSDEGTRVISDVMFGCANESEHSIVNDTRFNGVFGLGYHSEYLVKKLGS
ncbi:Aspartic peptidase domain containing protein, partial [Trema orientale]